MKANLLLTIAIVFMSFTANAQCHYIRSDATSPDTLTWTFYGGLFASYGCAPIDPTYWISGYGDSVLVTFIQPQAYPSFRVWGMNTDDSATVSVNGVPYTLNSSTASYNAKVVCGISPGPDGIGFSAGNVVGVLTDGQGNYSYQDVQLNATNVTSIMVRGLAGEGWGFAGVSVSCPLTAICNTTRFDTSATINCGSSVTIAGNAYTLSGIYLDTLQNAGGCDSIITVNLTALGDTVNMQHAICQGDSFYFNGVQQHDSGIYYKVLFGRNGCDTLVRLSLAVNALPVVTFSLAPLANAHDISVNLQGMGDSIYDWCQPPFFPGQFTMMGGSPPGGYYSGAGIYNGIIYRDSILPEFDYGLDSTLTPKYTYTDSNGCTQSVRTTLILDWCEGITALNNNWLNMYPNPTSNEVTLEVDASMLNARLQITDAIGQRINVIRVEATTFKINTSNLASGIYIVQLFSSDGRGVARKLVVER